MEIYKCRSVKLQRWSIVKMSFTANNIRLVHIKYQFLFLNLILVLQLNFVLSLFITLSKKELRITCIRY